MYTASLGYTAMSEVTIKDIAEQTGVSYATVSRTLNHLSGVSPATRDKVLAAAEEMGYRPNIHARSLKTNKTNTIALVLPDISNPFFADIAYAVDEYAFSRGYTTVLCNTNWNEEIEKTHLDQMQNQRVDGIIYKPAGQLPMDLSGLSIPSVLISCIPGENENYIEIDNYKGGQIAAEHLISCGYKHLAFIGGSRNSQSNEFRIAGFCDKLQEQGMPLNDDHILYGGFSMESGCDMAHHLLSHFPDVDGIFCGNDVIALGVLQHLMEINKNVPEEIGVVGFDDIILAGLPQIQMTTVAQPRSEIGKLSAEMLINTIDNKENQKHHIMLEPELVVRRSTRK
ncbi:MAG: LacI family DNA-binding transcriptional regulator [Anaerolineaceae bacterium]|nr:LacI family DNA-binding transcriptional regulator [Anaerolineaceae bacterium]